MDKPRTSHYLLLAVAIASVSPSSIIGRLAGEDEPSPSGLVISFYRLLFATLMLAPFALWNVRKETEQLSRRDMIFLAGVGFMLAAHFAVWVTSLFYTSIASSAVLVTTESLWVPLGAAFLLREHIGPRVWLGVAIAFSGSLVLVLGDSGAFGGGTRALIGDGLALAGAFAASLYFLASRHVRQKMSLTTYATIVYGWSTLFLFVFVLIKGDPFGGYSLRSYAWMFVFALVPMILGHTIINYILRWVQPHVVSTTVLLEPVISAVLAVFIFDESVGLLVYGGAVLILSGILLATTKPAPQPIVREQEGGQAARALGHDEAPSVVDAPQAPR